MASAWGDAWGDSWGDAWGSISIGPEPPAGGAARFTYERVPVPVARNDDDEVLLLIAL
jgi:hypothetical protein